jgi:CHAT domain-containing protein
MSRLFISHSSANNAEAVAIRDWLACEGWDEVFLDLDPARGIAAGERWERALNEAASRCEAVLFLISRAWLDSRWCLKEFNLARRLNKRLFGALIEAVSLAGLPEDLSGVWQVVDLASGHDHEMFRVALPVTQVEAHVTFSREGLARLRGGLVRAGLEPRFFDWPPKDDPDRSPYRGLKPLEAEDAGIFFGRDAPIVGALDTFRGLREAAGPRLLVILGASGSGKSSFLRAGILPRLARDDRNFLALPAIRPERAALTGEAGLMPALEAVLTVHGLKHRRADIRKAVAGGAETVRPLLQQISDKAFARTLGEKGAAPQPTIVIPIDQAEELFSAEGLSEGEALLGLLRDLAAEDRPGVIVLFAIRSDSYDRLETAKSLEGLQQQTLPLLPMPRGAYQTVIEGPAARLSDTTRRLRIEPRLTQGLLEDIEKGGGSDALPLLAFTLEQLYLDYGRGSGALTAADYDAFGGIGGAIEAAVERALKAADNDPRIPRERESRLSLLRRGLIPWLAGIDPETGSPRRRIARLSDVPAEAAPLIALLVEQRLLSSDAVMTPDGVRVPTVEPAHEALLRNWGLLRGWLEEEFAALTTLEAVKRAARDWAANARAPDWLNHAGGRLDDAEQIAARTDLAADLSDEARDYLRECRALEQARRREREESQARALRLQRRVLWAVGAGFAGALILAGLSLWQWSVAESEKREAQLQSTRAEKTLTVANAAANGLIVDVAQHFRNVTGVPITVIKSILDHARDLQRKLAESGQVTSALRRTEAEGLLETALTLLTLGDTPGALNAANSAKEIFEDLLSENSRDNDLLRGLSASYDAIGNGLTVKSRFDEALVEYQKALSLREKTLGLNHPDVGISLDNLAQIYEEENRIAEAEPLLKRALVIREEALGSDHPNVATSLNNLAVLYLNEGRYAEAEPLYKRSLAIREKALGPDHPDIALNLSNLAKIYRNQDRYQEAAPLIKRAVAIDERLAAEDSENTSRQRELSVAYDSLGDVLKADGHSDEALAVYSKALAIQEALALKDPANTLWQRDLATTLNSVALRYLADHQLDQALSTSARAVELMIKLLSIDAGQRVGAIATAQRVSRIFFTDYLKIADAAARTIPDHSHATTAETFRMVQMVQGSSAGAAIAGMATRLAAGNDALAAAIREHQDLVARRQVLLDAMVRATSKQPAQRDAAGEAALRAEFDEVGTKTDALDARIARELPNYRAPSSNPTPLSVAGAQKMLAADEALLVYLVTDQATWLWVLRSDNVALRRIGIGAQALSEEVSALRSYLDPIYNLDLRPYPAFRAYTLYQEIIGPAASLLTGIHHLLIVPDGGLQSLPISALVTRALPHDPATITDHRNVAWVARDYASTVLPSVGTLRALREYAAAGHAPKPFVGIGDPVLGKMPLPVNTISELFRGAAIAENAVRGLPRLPETANELRVAARELGATDHDLYLGPRASEPVLRAAGLDQYRIVEFATHGLASGSLRGLAEPALVLTPPEQPTPDNNGLLTLSKIVTLKLNADLVVLSACDTDAGAPSSLATGFFYAGARSVLAAKWALASRAAVALTTRIFAEVGKDANIGRAEALRRAEMSMLDPANPPEFAHPMMWAPFVLAGEGGAAK